ncbi:hypothetical protein Aduo_008703 [Ancylostoma duodenale]
MRSLALQQRKHQIPNSWNFTVETKNSSAPLRNASPPQHYERVDRLNPAGEEELDLLDLAPELSHYSRLVCENGVRDVAVHVCAADLLLCTVERQLFFVDLSLCCTSAMLSLFDCQVL